MAVNGITSGKVPARRGSKPIRGVSPMFEGDELLEQRAGKIGKKGRLAAVQAQPIVGASDALTRDLLRQGGVTIRERGRSIDT